MLGKKARVNYGMVYTHIIDHSRQDYVPTEDTTTDKLPSPLYSRRTEDILNIYGGGSMNLSDKLSAEFSLAAEHSKTTLWDEWDLYPTLSATYMPSSGHMWQISFSTEKKCSLTIYVDYLSSYL